MTGAGYGDVYSPREESPPRTEREHARWWAAFDREFPAAERLRAAGYALCNLGEAQPFADRVISRRTRIARRDHPDGRRAGQPYREVVTRTVDLATLASRTHRQVIS